MKNRISSLKSKSGIHPVPVMDAIDRRGAFGRRSWPVPLAAGLLAATALFGLFGWPVSRATARQFNRPQGTVFVHDALGGQILGYDIDQNGTEGLLTEYVSGIGGNNTVATETFDQMTGKITAIVARINFTKNDYVILGVVGSHVGLIEFEHVTNLYVDGRRYLTLNPLNSNKFTGSWRPPFLTTDDIIETVSANQGGPNNAIMYFNNGPDFSSLVFETNVAANTFGPVFKVQDQVFDENNSPVMAYDTRNNQAVLGSSYGSPTSTPEIGTVDLATGALTEFTGLGLGFVNGISYDSTTGVACTATEIDFSVEFYNVSRQTGVIVPLPGAVSQAQRGEAVANDPLHGLCLVGQPITSTGKSGSSIQVFDETGDFIESINGFGLPASPTRIALHPSVRFGYVLSGVSELQSFTY
ncbi:MAG TPA: hypothetical protein VL523_18830 [Terriglobia bacterium]|nr:hypothetical protein [Terriglobia bacterium]